MYRAAKCVGGVKLIHSTDDAGIVGIFSRRGAILRPGELESWSPHLPYDLVRCKILRGPVNVPHELEHYSKEATSEGRK